MARPKQKQPNPISAAVREWLDQSPPDLATIESDNVDQLVAEAPRRWVIYEPLVLLPSGSFTSPLWRDTLARVAAECRDDLWRRVLHRIGQKTPEQTTHLAVNDGIPLTIAAHLGPGEGAGDLSQQESSENILRSPIGLRTLYGDFGPEAVDRFVSDEDFNQAFWASTKQNGIHQTWAPRWTMFSRGNVKEKARLLAFHERPRVIPDDEKKEPCFPHRVRSGATLKGTWAVDLYAGIGYFVFSYAKMGMKVLGWELNPWSVEGLRRGAQANGWSVKVVQGDDLTRPTQELVSGGDTMVVFLENNQEAPRRIKELRAHNLDLPVLHVNCGLLPRSDDSWPAARGILGGDSGGWLHLHENVGVKDIESRRAEVRALFDAWDQQDGVNCTAKVEYVELVKTFAPDVWHCVFDVYITRSSDNSTSQ